MEDQFLINNEKIIVKSGNGRLVLTNLRILKNPTLSGDGYFISMHLENISTMEITSKSSPGWLLLALVSAALCFTVAANDREIGLLIFGAVLILIFVLLYFVTRHHIVSVASNGGAKLHVKTEGMKQEVILDFVKKIDQARHLITQKESAENP